MSYSEYSQHVEQQTTPVCVEDAFYVAPTEHWELSDFDDIVRAD